MVDRVDRTRITADASQFNAEMEAAAEKYLTESQRISSAMREAMGSVQQSTRQAVDRSKADAGLLGDAWGKVKGQIVAAVAGAVSIGAMTAAVNKTAQMAREAEILGRQLGISATEASVLTVALGDIEQSSDKVLAANKALTTTLREDEQAIQKLGVATRDQNGNFRNSLDIMLDVNKRLAEFTEGANRNIEGQKIYKRGWEEAAPLVKLNAELMEQAKVKAAALNLALGQESLATSTKYRAALNDAKDVVTALQKTIGEALMPVLTQLGTEFSENGPKHVQAMREAMGHLIVVFYSVKTVVVSVWEIVKAFAASIGVAIGTMAELAAARFTGNWRRAVEAVKNQWTSLKDIGTEAFTTIAAEAEKNSKAAADALERAMTPPKTTPAARAAGGTTSTGGDKKSSELMAGLEAELAAKRDAHEREAALEGTFRQFSKAEESRFWQDKLELHRGNKELEGAISKRYFEAEREVRKQAFDAEIAEIRGRIERHNQGSMERIALAGDAARKIGDKYGLESAQYKVAQAEVMKLAAERQKMQDKLAEMAIDRSREAGLAALALEREAIDTAAQLGIISGQERIERLRNLKQTEYAYELQGEMDKAAIYADNEVAYAQHLERLARLREKHTLEMKKLDGESMKEFKKSLDAWMDPVGQAVQTMANGVLMGTQKMSDVFRNALRGMLVQYMATLVKMGVEWVKVEILKTQATQTGAVTRMAIETWAGITSSAIALGTAMKNIAIKAWEVAANVYSSVAMIPFVGWILAPIMALAAAATVMAFVGKARSAKGGYDVPPGLNPMTQLHEEEMVLPAHFANPLRDLLLEGGGAGASGMPPIHVHAMDSRDVIRALKDGGALNKALRSTVRGFAPLNGR